MTAKKTVDVCRSCWHDSQMILFSFGEKHETVPEFTHCGRRGWRWVIDVGRWDQGVHATLEQQVVFHDPPHSGKWRPANHYVSLALVRKFAIGEAHDYYDGPHCSLKLGWLRLNWSWNWCKKCMPDQENG